LTSEKTSLIIRSEDISLEGVDNLNIRELREAKGLTQEALAEIVGVDRTTITKIENETSKPSVETAKKISKVLGFDWTQFFENNS